MGDYITARRIVYDIVTKYLVCIVHVCAIYASRSRDSSHPSFGHGQLGNSSYAVLDGFCTSLEKTVGAEP